MNGKVLLFNPRSADSKPRIPNSILAAAAAIEGKYEYFLVDGNLEKDSYSKYIHIWQTAVSNTLPVLLCLARSLSKLF